MSKKTSSSVATYTRSYLYQVDPHCNAGKLVQLHAMQNEWQRLLPLVGEHCWSQFLRGERPTASLSSAVGPASVFGATPLVTSMKQCMAVAVEGQLKSWKSNFQRRITRLIMRSRRYATQPEVRHQILWLNSLYLWAVPLAEQQALLAVSPSKTKVTQIAPRSSQVLRRYLRAYLHRFRAPCFENLPMQVNQMSSVWSAANTTTHPGAKYWLRISTLERGQRITLPIRGNSYADKVPGVQALTFSLIQTKGHWYVKVCKKIPRPDPRPASGPVLGIDSGMVNLLATSQGALFGKGFNLHLRRWDNRLQHLTKGLQQAGIVRLSETRRYRDFVHRMRAWITSEIRRAVNRALALGQPSTVVIEALNFSSQPGRLSKKMNRLVRRMGTGVIKHSLTMKSEEQGFRLVQVKPADTSQECHACGFISRANRKKNLFRCVCCGKQAHADAQAARNLVKRFHAGRVDEYVKHTTVGMRSLEIWGGVMLSRLTRSIPGTSPYQGAFGCVQAGLRVLKGKGDTLPVIQQLQRLLNGVSSTSTPCPLGIE